MLATALNLASAFSGIIAAGYWHQSAMIKAPTELTASVAYGGPATVDTEPLVEFAQKIGRLNKIAARLTALAALLMALAANRSAGVKVGEPTMLRYFVGFHSRARGCASAI
jgi:hypothetical protein